jgi:Uncharacterized conserved protein
VLSKVKESPVNGGGFVGLTPSGSHMFACGYHGLYVYDMSNPAAPTVLSKVKESPVGTGQGADLALSGSHVFACGYHGLYVYDMSNPAALP